MAGIVGKNVSRLIWKVEEWSGPLPGVQAVRVTKSRCM
jgi:hypothetical protein